MQRLSLFSEPFQPTGSIASEGIRNVLGRPAMDLLTLLVRESGQNSWDARADEQGPIEFRIDGWRLTQPQLGVARDTMFAERPANIPLPELLDGANESPSVLMISDRGTSGLGGPVRADQIVEEDAPRDFVDFLRNVGQPPDKRFGGGTFGYGKSVLYNASLVGTILVHTRCRVGDRFESRFIAAALGGQFRSELEGVSRPFTGRHWWGRMADGVIDPLLGDEADALAASLGFPSREGSDTGTSVMVLGPRFEERPPEEALAFLAEAAIWNFWPKMVEVEDHPVGMRIGVSWQGRELSVMSPEEHPRLRGFVSALRQTESPDGARLAVKIERPKAELGWLAFHRFAVVDHAPDRPGADAAPLGPAVHHVALMRSPRNVVRYIAGDPLPHEAAGYAGVFVVDPAVDDAFAQAEPPSHDDWLPEVLPRGNDKRYVNVALRNIRAELKNHVAPPAPPRGDAAMPPLGALSQSLAAIFPWESGSGADVPLDPGTGATQSTVDERPTSSAPMGDVGGGPAGSDASSVGVAGGVRLDRDVFPARGRMGRAILQVNRPRPEVLDGEPIVRLTFTVAAAAESPATLVTLNAAVAVRDGESVESEPPENARGPRLLYWEGPGGHRVESTEDLRVPRESPGPWSALVNPGGDLAIGLNLTARPLPA